MARTELEEPLATGMEAVLIVSLLLLASIPLILAYTTLILTSFADTIVSNPWVHFHFTIDNWIAFFRGELSTTRARIYTTSQILWMIGNTIIVAAGVALVVLAGSITSAYAYSRMKYRWRMGALKLLLLLHAFPGVALIVGVYTLYYYTLVKYVSLQHRLLYSFVFVIFARASLELPMSIWILKGFFDRVPWELEWAVIVDGGSRWTALRHAMLPLVKPGIAAVAIFAFLAGWEDLIYVMVFLPPQAKTLATFIEGQLAGGSLESSYLPILAAAGTLYLLPTILFFVFTQRLLMETMSGGVKG
ncbi:MAG: carbohydrate ABC transporter permease [Desulfurococcales archaeon]|nr:carbohydrate ABC transporter permease [Desulfurococcales archaeon]